MIRDESTKQSGLRLVGKTMVGTLNTGFLQLITLEKSIKSAPFPITRDGIDALDDDLVIYLLTQLDELNGPLVNETEEA